MKFSATDWSFLKKSGLEPQEYYEKLKKAGFDAVEMTEPALRETARKAGLEVLNISCPGMEKGLNRKENHADLLPKIKDCIYEAADNKVKYVIVFSGARAGQDDSEGLKNCRTAVETLIPDAEKTGVEIHFEGFNTYDHPDYQGSSSRYMFSLVKAVNSPYFKALFDIYHMEMAGEYTASIIRDNLDLIGHLHVAGAGKRLAPKMDGLIKYPEIVKQATSASYSRYWGLEFFPSDDVLGDFVRVKNEMLKASKVY